MPPGAFWCFLHVFVCKLTQNVLKKVEIRQIREIEQIQQNSCKKHTNVYNSRIGTCKCTFRPFLGQFNVKFEREIDKIAKTLEFYYFWDFRVILEMPLNVYKSREMCANMDIHT